MIPLLLMFLAVLATAGRVLGLMLASVVVGWFLAYQAIKSKTFENVFIAAIEVFESVPVISFFPIVLTLFVLGVGGPLGVEFAADFLVFTAVVWNIWMGEYQAFKTVPREMLEVSQNFRFGLLDRLRYIYIPFSVPRISANLFPSVSDGFFYITVSEVFAIGIHTYRTFGVGTLLDSYIARDLWTYVVETFIVLGIVIAIVIIGLREFSKRAVAKYTLDTDMPIVRRGRLNVRESIRFTAMASVNPLNRLAKYNVDRRRRRGTEQDKYYEAPRQKNYGYAWAGVGVLILALLLYGAYHIIASVSLAEWGTLFRMTPTLLLGLLYDYARVAIITLVAFVFSIFVGYYFAMNARAESVGVPVIQGFSAYPVPTYFPFVFLAAVPFLNSIFGQYTSEVFVLF
ncbi:MAG: sugar ABC transporter permease, partial [Candidatus Thermoplasmatota archaeon]|nr:sugar ABC transporter permease [Candidatus Thermoplasmatota archaeon]